MVETALIPNIGPGAEVGDSLASVVRPDTPVRVGDALAALGRDTGLTDQDFAAIEHLREKPPAEPLSFE